MEIIHYSLYIPLVSFHSQQQAMSKTVVDIFDTLFRSVHTISKQISECLLSLNWCFIEVRNSVQKELISESSPVSSERSSFRRYRTEVLEQTSYKHHFTSTLVSPATSTVASINAVYTDT